MQINRSEKSKYNDIIEIVVSPEDYRGGFEKNLKNYSKKAEIKGFRKGNVPLGMVKKMYGEAILADEINKLAEKCLSEYLVDNQINVLGRPMLTENHEKFELRPNEDKDYAFKFEIGYEPEFELKFKSKQFEKYVINIDKKMIEKEINNIKSHFAQLEDSDGPMEGGDSVYFSYDNGKGVKGESYAIEQDFTEEGLKVFKEKKKADKVSGKAFDIFDMNKLDVKKYIFNQKEGEEYSDNEWQEEFEFEITNVKKKKLPNNLTEEQIISVTGDQTNNTINELEIVVEERIKSQYENISVNYLRNDIHEYILEENSIELPVDFLQRWIASEEENKMTLEQVKDDFDGIESSIKWDLFTNKYARENEIKVEVEEVKNELRVQYMQYFANSGFNPPAEELEKYINKALQDQNTSRKTYESIQDGKVLDHIIDNHMKIKEIKYTEDQFVEESKKRTQKK